MSKRKKTKKAINFQAYITKRLKNPEFRKHYNEYGKQLEVAYQILQLRKRKKISQTELARKLGTTQSNVARMEAGQQNFTTDTLQKIASIFNRELKIDFIK